MIDGLHPETDKNLNEYQYCASYVTLGIYYFTEPNANFRCTFPSSFSVDVTIQKIGFYSQYPIKTNIYVLFFCLVPQHQ